MKKFIKTTLSLALVAMLTLSCASLALAEPVSSNLKFGSDGKFTILQLADTQDKYPANTTMIAFINEVLDEAEPDLVIFTGDNVVCDDARAYDEILNPVVERGIPFTMVYGNHDDESDPGRTKEDMLAIYQSYEGCLAYDADPALTGCATHNLTIEASDSTDVAFNLWMFDSNAYFDGEGDNHMYGCVCADQVEWYKTTSAALETQNGKKIPSLAFQHIIPEEAYRELYFESPNNTNLGGATKNFEDGASVGYLPQLDKYEGYILEPGCPSMKNFGEWDAFIERGDVLGCAIGHDHVNSFVADVKGVDIIQTPGCTWNSYGNDFVRGARVLTLDESDLWSYETKVITAAELAAKSGSKIPDEDNPASKYKFIVFLQNFMAMMNRLLKAFDFPV
ncbi:MAG: metallophosphoesterase family protein [Clostridiales bacterium]|nr:metallophosphoesterase family protein [Clostridiales bacterium]